MLFCAQPNAKRQKDNAKSLSLRSKQQVPGYAFSACSLLVFCLYYAADFPSCLPVQLLNQENRLVVAAPVIGLGRTKNQPFSATGGKLAPLRGSKAKVSETVTSSKHAYTFYGFMAPEKISTSEGGMAL